jgi:HSP20 family molecular chaperone IbpA
MQARSIAMKNFILTVSSVLLLAAASSAAAWHDHEYYPAFRELPDWNGGYQPLPGRSASSSGFRVHIERGIYDGGYLLHVYTRGIRPQDIDVSVDRGRIRLRSEVSSHNSWQDEYRRSRVSGYSTFSRIIPLPYDADAGKLEVITTDDVLEIRIPRR